MRQRLQFLVVADQRQSQPLVADSDFALGQLALGLFAGRGYCFVLLGKAIEFRLIVLVLDAKLVNSPSNRGERLLQLFQLPVDDLEVHQPGYLFTQVVPPLMLCASRKVLLSGLFWDRKIARQSAPLTRMV